MTLRELSPDFDKWPEEWMGTKEDREYGKKLLPFMESFLNDLIKLDLSTKTLKNHRDNVALLGRSIITQVSTYEEHHVPSLTMLRKSVETGGMLPDGHADMTEKHIRAFERTCELFEKFLEKAKKTK
jgi:hypothetical protein